MLNVFEKYEAVESLIVASEMGLANAYFVTKGNVSKTIII